jgi:hypothetical protein
MRQALFAASSTLLQKINERRRQYALQILKNIPAVEYSSLWADVPRDFRADPLFTTNHLRWRFY